jgi:hypothetical protein
MQNVKQFFHLHFYEQVLSGKKHFSIMRAILVLASILTVFVCIRLYWFVFTTAPKVDSLVKEIIANGFPDNTKIVLKDGQITTNLNNPFVVFFPQSTNKFLPITQLSSQNLLTIDVNAHSSTYRQSKTLILVARDSVVLPSWIGGTVDSLEKMQDRELTKTDLYLFYRQLPLVRKIYGFMVLGLVLSPPIFFIAQMIGMVFSLLLYGSVVHVVVKTYLPSMSNRRIYRFTAALICLPTLIIEATGWLPILSSLKNFSYWISFLVVGGLAYVVIKHHLKKGSDQ